MVRKYWRHPLPYLVAFLVTIVYIYLSNIIQLVILQPSFRNFAYQDIRMITSTIQKYFIYPFGDYFTFGPRMFFVFPYWVMIMIVLRAIYLHTRKIWKYLMGLSLGLLLLLCLFPSVLLQFEQNFESESIGHVRNGRIENSKRMPYEGKNFKTYSLGAYLFGRTFIHQKVRKVLLESYQICEATCPDKTFVLGELGHRKGGLFIPHEAHQNGLSVDFMVPMLKDGTAYKNHHLLNLWGYANKFDAKGKCNDVEIDFEAMAHHLKALDKAAQKNGIVLQKIIFNPVLQDHLFATKTGATIDGLPFSKERHVVQHHNHYHIDFGIKTDEYSEYGMINQ